MTRAALNNSVWILSLVLQFSLLALLFVRGISRRVIAFTTIIAFYPLRSITLFLLAAIHLAPESYATTTNILSIIDLLLQFLVAAEIALQLQRASGLQGRRWLWLLALPALAWAGTLLVIQLLPARAPIPPDRLQIFDSLTMILLCVWTMLRPVPALLRRITLGFAFYGAVSLLGSAGRASAAIHRDPQLFARWAYILPAVYLAVVLFWIATLKPSTD